MVRLILATVSLVFLLFLCFAQSVMGQYVCGDANGDNQLNVGDAVFMINYIFKGGPGPADGCCETCSNGETRSCYSGAEGTEGIGECRGGIQTCTDGDWGPCVGEVTPVDELCDGLDNNCNDLYDEDFPEVGQACDGPDADLCETGIWECRPDGTGLICEETVNFEEVCDGDDNDCSGIPDDNLTPPACAEPDLGVCAGATAARICSGSSGWTACDYGPNYESVENSCSDGLDNDCDGLTDAEDSDCAP